jgi:multicomponent Na+:H+ antiporter subunit C
VSVAPFVVAVWLLLVGLYGAVTSRNLIHLVGCVSVTQSSTYVLLLSIGFRHHATAPVFKDIPTTAPVVDPIVAALTLTDVVVSAVVTALLLAFAIQTYKRVGTLDPDELRELQG